MKRGIFLSLIWLSGLCAAQTSKHPFTFEDWAAMHKTSPRAVSPDGGTILYTVGWGAMRGQGTQEFRLIGKDGAGSRKLDLPAGFRPSGFMSNGSLYGTYRVNDETQLAIFPLEGLTHTSKPARLILVPGGVEGSALSPDGSRFACAANPRPPDDLSSVRTVIEADERSLYVVNADGSSGAWWCPELKHVGSFAWSPDGSSIAAVSGPPKIGNHLVRSDIDICTSTGARRVASIPNATSGIAWAEGGKELAFVGTTNDVLTPDHLWTVPATGGKPMDRTPRLDGSVMELTGDPRGGVWVMVDRGVQNEVDSFSGGSLRPAYRWQTGAFGGLPVFSELSSGSSQLVFVVSDPEHSENLAVPQGSDLQRITTESDEQLSHVEFGTVKTVHWTSKEGVHLEGILTLPAGYTPGKRYPFLVMPHGGPEGNDLLTLEFDARIIAGLGYVVLQPQYRGSTGYGAEFLEAIYQHFGDRAYRDVDSATDFAIEQGWADPNRLSIFGWSAGGFMTAWTVTQTNRYKAAIEGAGITDWASFMWTSDVQQYDYDGRWPGKDPQAFNRFSAVLFVDRVKTPILVLHGAADVRVPTYQGREYFEALLASGKTTRMVTYPGSGHFPNLWEQRQDVFREIAAWLEKYNP